MFRFHPPTVSFALALGLALASCGGGDGDSVPGPPDDPAIDFSVPRVFSSLAFQSPVAMVQAPEDDSRWFVVEQDGFVRAFENDESVAGAASFIDISARVASPDDGAGGETGLLGMAFHPDFPADPRAYLSYTATVGGDLVSRVSEFRTADDGQTLDPGTELVLLTVAQPESNHNGGGIVFGPDDFLYIGFGDGGGSGDDHGDSGNGQNLRTLLGKMLRIDVDDPATGFNYGIPDDNAFAGNALCGDGGFGTDDCPEIHAYGFRNPWRWSFDSQTGDLWVGDVGQGEWEEIDNVVAGGNYGWRCREGAHEFDAGCDDDDVLDPVAEYDHGAGFSVTGGYVYHGAAIEDLAGHYVFGDFGGVLWHIAADTYPTLKVTAAGGFDTGLQIASFAEGMDGELYIVDLGGTLHRVEADE